MGNLSKRKQIEDETIKWIGKISDADSAKLYVEMFKGMNDKEFTDWMEKNTKKKINLAIVQVPGKKNTATVEKNLAIADEMGINILDRLVLEEPDGAVILNLLTTILRLPVKRQSQVLSHKIGVPEHDKTVDITTGQRTSASKGAKITLPELQLLDALGLDKVLVELLKVRGGDNGAYRAMLSSLENYGSANLDTIEKYSTGVQSSHTLEAIFNSMMLDINLTKAF